jgi:8-oxo-dGTP pyrophosphatase MutT (NUDIX family)
MTGIEVGVVDVFVLRVVRKSWRVLLLRRGARTRSTGSWETVHGRIEPGETPPRAALREVLEETGLEPDRLYSITVNPFYLHQTGAVQLAVVFAAFVASERVRLGPEHDRHAWLTVPEAAKRFTWPREAEALVHIRRLLRSGTAGAVEDVLRMP